MAAPDDDHYSRVVTHIVEGTIVPLLGAGVNAPGRPADEPWSLGSAYLPDAPELAGYLARAFRYPAKDAAEIKDLARVAQYVAVMDGSGPLYTQLQRLFCGDYRPTPVHTFLATLPRRTREEGYPPRYQLVVTTNYDDALEQAFRAAEEPYDLATYIADGPHKGRFVHSPADEEPRVIERSSNEYVDFPVDERGVLYRTVILKIHGAVDRSDPPGTWSSYVITEDHYIDYLSRSELSRLIPTQLLAKMMQSHFLFLGYSMRDWNLRVILQRIWGEQPLDWKSWAVQLEPDKLDEKFWDERGVDILDVPLDEYVGELEQRIPAVIKEMGITP
jgi:hypothetical protein